MSKMDDSTRCKGSMRLGTACGHCIRCKAAAFDWLREHSNALDYWAVMQTGQHDLMKAVMQKAKDNK